MPAGMRARYVRLTERMVMLGPDLGMPHTRALGRGLFELRLRSEEGTGRVFFCLCDARQVMMLQGFVKKSGRTPPGVIRTARRRMSQVRARC